MKAISQQVRYRRMQSNICIGLESMRTAHNIPEGPWRKLGIDYFAFNGNSYVLICDYFSKFPFLYRAKTSFWSLRDHLIDLFSIEGYPDEIVSDNGPPFQSKEFAKFLSGLGIKHTTSSLGYPRSNGFIERHIQMVKNMLSKSSNTWSFQEVLADLRTTHIGMGLPSTAEILHGRNLTTRVQAEIDIKAIHSVLQERQLKMTLDHNTSRRAKKARQGTMMMEVKVDAGAQPSCIPLHKFKTLFPHLCRDGLPKEGLLDNTQNEFQSYNGGDMTCYGHLLIDVKDKVTKKYHPIRFYVMNTDVPRILISHAASYWLGLVKVLCDNKAPRIKRQVASIDKKSNFGVKSGHFRTSTPNVASSSQKKQMTPKTVTSGKVHIPSPRMHSFEDAKIQGAKRATGVRPGRDVDVSDGEQHSQEEPSVTTGKEPKTSKSGNLVHSGPNKNIMDSVKDGPFSNQTTDSSNAKSGPKMKHTSKKDHVGSITSHLMIPRHFRSTTKVTSSVYKTPTSSTSQMTKANCQAAGKHQSTMNQEQCHARPWRI